MTTVPTRRRAPYVLLAVIASTAIAIGILVAGAARTAHESDGYDGAPAAVHADASPEAAGDVAVYVLRLYSQAVADGEADPEPSLKWMQGWGNTFDFELVTTARMVGGGVKGGSFGDATVSSVEETGRREYEVTLDAPRDAQTIIAATGAVVAEFPAMEFHPVITLTNQGAHWRVDRLLLVSSDADR
jgi:hypothetical protein